MKGFAGRITWPGWELDLLGRTLVMGVINVTPDSFSDGGLYFDPGSAIEHGLRLVDEGADILDVGGQSTRPGSETVDDSEQIRRTAQVIRALAGQVSVPISIDTSSAEVARSALDVGAGMVNDITALQGDPTMAEVAAGREVPVILMHMQGRPRTMQENPYYQDVVAKVKQFLRRSVERAVAAGVQGGRIIIDPGIGFGKRLEHNLALLGNIDQLLALDMPVMVGTSRKQFIGEILAEPVDRRLFGTLATVGYLAAAGVHIVRVHDVKAAYDVVRMIAAIGGGKSG